MGNVRRTCEAGGAAAAAMAACVLAAPAHAQTGGVDQAELGEVVVTARKRTETLHDAPLSVAVVEGAALREMPLASAQDLNGAVPGLAMQLGLGNVTSATFRGLGSNSALYSVESSVALFIDGVYMGHPRAFATPLYDIERFEMVKGTQATLLGKNTSVGAISQITRRPGPGFDYFITTTYEFEHDSPRVEAALNAPLGTSLAVRVAALFDRDGGHMENAFTGEGEGRTENVSGRLALRWSPTDALDVDLSYQHDHRIQWGQYLEVLRDATAGASLANRAAATGQSNFEARPDYRNSSASFAVGAVPPGPPVKDTQVGDRANLVTSWSVAGHVLTSQTAFLSYEVQRTSDVDFLAAHLFDLFDNERDRQFTQELRLASDAARRLSYMVGLYYLRDTWSLDRSQAGFSPAPGVFPLTGSATTYFTQRTEALSAFAHMDLKLTDRIAATGGLRYTSEDKTGHYLRPPGAGLLGLSYPAIPASVLKVGDDTLDGDMGLQYRPDDDLMLYASWSKGSKSSGLQNFPTTLGAAPYTGESAYTIEVGAKKRLGASANLDVAVFETEVKDYQFTRIALVQGLSQSVVANVDIRSRGAELNGWWRLPGGTRLSGGMVYSDVKALETVPTPPAQAAIVQGLRLPRAPKLTGNVALDHAAAIGAGLTLRLHIDAQYSSAMFLQPDFGASRGAPRREAYVQANARLALANDGKGWEVALVGRNLTDANEPIFATPIPASGVLGTNTVGYAGTLMAPRQIALQISLRR